VRLTVNGIAHELPESHADESLLRLLRDGLGLTGTKNACEQGECGSCTVAIDGELACACLVPAIQARDTHVETVESLAAADGTLHPIQDAFIAAGAVQCGFCTPGLLVATRDLLRRIPDPTPDDIRHELAGNLCRCTGYEKIIEAVRLAAVETGP
jgi:carbon-monoxide dehydrogenase small subunit